MVFWAAVPRFADRAIETAREDWYLRANRRGQVFGECLLVKLCVPSVDIRAAAARALPHHRG